MNEDLMRKISDALDPTEGLEADAELRAALDADPDAADYARDLASIDEALRGMGAAGRAEPDWDAMLDRIDARLDEDLDELEDIGDVTAPPELADDEAPATSAERQVAVATAAAAEPAPAPVVDLSARRRRRRLITAIGGLAAAAAVGLGITAGLSMDDGMAPASEAPVATSAVPASPAEAVEEASLDEAPAEEPAPMAFRGYESDEADEAEPEPVTAAGAAAPRLAREMPRRPRTRSAPAARSQAVGRSGFGGGSTSASAGGGAGGVDDVFDGEASDAPSAEPTRPEVMSALATVTDAVQRCIGDTGEIARVHVRVNGSTGRVESVRVSPPYTGTQAACIVRAVRGARLPRSQRPSYEVTYAYRPAGRAAGSLQKNQPALRQRRPAPSERQMDLLDPR